MVGKWGRSSWGNGIIWHAIELEYRLVHCMHVKSSIRSTKMPTSYPLRVQAIRSRGQNPRLYVSFPLAVAAAIGLEPGKRSNGSYSTGVSFISSGPTQLSPRPNPEPPSRRLTHHKATIFRLIAKSIRFPGNPTTAAINNHKPASPWGRALYRKCPCPLCTRPAWAPGCHPHQ